MDAASPLQHDGDGLLDLLDEGTCRIPNDPVWADRGMVEAAWSVASGSAQLRKPCAVRRQPRVVSGLVVVPVSVDHARADVAVLPKCR